MAESLLIVGGTGFIGRCLTEHAIKRGFNTIVLSSNTAIDNNKVKGADYIRADIVNLTQLRKQLPITPIDYVVNLSGYIDHSSFLGGGREIIDTHFIGMQNLLQALDWDALKRFVQIGSSDEYGNHPAPQNEEMRAYPISPYSLGKVASTQLLQMLFRTEAFPAVILRLFLVYGPGQGNKRFLPQIIEGCLSGANFPTSHGEQLRDFCYVDDVVSGIFMTLKNDKVNGEIFNLASGKPVIIREIVEYIQKVIGKGNPEFGKLSYRAVENMTLYADISKAKKVLGWEATVTFEEGIKRTIEDYQKVIL